MNVNVKSKTNVYCFFNRKLLLTVSLLFIAPLVFSPLIAEVNGWIDLSVEVETEVELVNAINASPEEGYVIGIRSDIVLEKSLEIPDGKRIILISWGASLIGADGVDTIIVKSGGYLSVYGNLVITHAEGDSGRGVFVESGGTFDFVNGKISGNSAVKGGGVYNEGTFTTNWHIEAADSVISGNTATEGGGCTMLALLQWRVVIFVTIFAQIH